MTVGQILKHIANACGAGCKGRVTGDWGLPEGMKVEDLPPEELLPSAEKLPTIAQLFYYLKLRASPSTLWTCGASAAQILRSKTRWAKWGLAPPR